MIAIIFVTILAINLSINVRNYINKKNKHKSYKKNYCLTRWSIFFQNKNHPINSEIGNIDNYTTEKLLQKVKDRQLNRELDQLDNFGNKKHKTALWVKVLIVILIIAVVGLRQVLGLEQLVKKLNNLTHLAKKVSSIPSHINVIFLYLLNFT